MKILLLGARGQLGWQLRRSLAPLGELTALTRGSAPWCGDLAQPLRLRETLRALRPDWIVNAAAYTRVDDAEAHADEAFAINANACEMLAREATGMGAWLMHFSTDYVFDGRTGGPWREDDATHPLNVYGRSKLAGEEAIQHEGGKHLILRTSWLYDVWGANFVKTVLQAARRGAPMKLVAGHTGSPTRAAGVADVAAHLVRSARPEHAGLYHVAGSGETTWEGLARHVLACSAGCGGPVPEAPWPTTTWDALARPAARPADSRLDCSRLAQTFGLALPDWRLDVEAVVTELLEAGGLP